MKTVFRVLLILLAALAVTGATYAVSQTTWFNQQLAGAPGGRGERGRGDLTASLSNAAQRLGVATEELREALGGVPPNYASAAQRLGRAEAEVRAAVEASLAERGSGRRPDGEFGERHESGLAGGVNAAALATFGRALLPMALMIGGVALVRAVVGRSKRRHAQPV